VRRRRARPSQVHRPCPPNRKVAGVSRPVGVGRTAGRAGSPCSRSHAVSTPPPSFSSLRPFGDDADRISKARLADSTQTRVVFKDAWTLPSPAPATQTPRRFSCGRISGANGRHTGCTPRIAWLRCVQPHAACVLQPSPLTTGCMGTSVKGEGSSPLLKLRPTNEPDASKTWHACKSLVQTRLAYWHILYLFTAAGKRSCSSWLRGVQGVVSRMRGSHPRAPGDGGSSALSDQNPNA
jgi:hypothetical protein